MDELWPNRAAVRLSNGADGDFALGPDMMWWIPTSFFTFFEPFGEELFHFEWIDR